MCNYHFVKKISQSKGNALLGRRDVPGSVFNAPITNLSFCSSRLDFPFYLHFQLFVVTEEHIITTAKLFQKPEAL